MRICRFILILILLSAIVLLGQINQVINWDNLPQRIDGGGVKIGNGEVKIELGMQISEAEKILTDNGWQQLSNGRWQRNDKKIRIWFESESEVVEKIMMDYNITSNDEKVPDNKKNMLNSIDGVDCEMLIGDYLYLRIFIG